jgi:hypothetical protein
MPGTIQTLFNNFFEEGNPVMKPWIKRTLFGLFGVSLLVGGLTACGHRHGYGADLKALVAGDKFDKTRAQALVTEKTAAVTTKSPEVIAALADFYDSLNPAQQQKVREFMDKRGRWYHRG